MVLERLLHHTIIVASPWSRDSSNAALESIVGFSAGLSPIEETLLGVYVGLCGLGVTCSPRDPRFAGSNPAEVDGFFQDVKILSTSPPGGTLSWGFRV